VVVLSKGIEPLKDPSKTNYPDPHIWHDASLWRVAAQNLRDALIKRDPDNAKLYQERTEAYLKELDALHREVKASVETIPAQKRVLVTSHDAFQYFGRAYGLEVVAVQGLSTESEAGARDLARVIEVVKGRQVPAVFVETSVNPKLMEQISRETGAGIGGTLYSDSLGAKGEPGQTYTGMLRANTERITRALGGAP
jgi:ABC-type Zn uptake system ZnuABC Zn-binding protein ZnuA